ncbi:MAG TPA: carboxypeptidase-like regulatory domain-containing protein, partial [Anaerolineales bacterium]|nr:carboxypeptidase-like regulatory domain-containing protein [Anaerolineales bacterium]
DIEQVLPPPNDFYAATATIPSLPFSDVQDVGAATQETDEPQHCGSIYETVWYSFTPAETMLVRADTEDSTWSANINIYRATGPSITDLEPVTCTRFFSGVFLAEADVTYILQAGLEDPVSAELHINLKQVFPPPNDHFADVIAIDTLPAAVSLDISGASAETDEPGGCTSQTKTAWYSITPTEAISLRADTIGSNNPVNITVYTSNGPGFEGLSLLGCVFWFGLDTFTLQPDQTYYLQVSGEAGTVQFNLTQVFPPINDFFAIPLNVTTLPFSETVEITDTSIESNEPQNCLSMNRTVWYAFSPGQTLKVRADTLGSAIDGNINIYRQTGSDFSSLEFLTCSGPYNPVSFQAEAGQTYFLQAGPAFSQLGSIQVNLAEMPAITGRITNALTGEPLPGSSDPFAAAHLYRICGEGCLEFVNAQQVDEQGRFHFDANLFGTPLIDGEYQITGIASLYPNRDFGPFTFSGTNLDVGDLPLTPPAQIRGRVVDAATGDPLPGASVALYRCESGSCFEFIGSQGTDDSGLFRFATSQFGLPLAAGTYEVEISANERITVRLEVTLAESQDQNLGDVALEPVPFLGSISGRLVDDLTGLPISPDFMASVQLFGCTGSSGCTFVNVLNTDADGRFHIATDYFGNRLPAGEYQILGQADQYFLRDSEHFTVGEEEDYDTGDIGLTSFPVRFSQVQHCNEIPAAGGECEFTVLVTNGTDRTLKGKTWSMANVGLPDSFIGFTHFQVKDQQDLDLGAGRSKIFRFHLRVPENNSSSPASACTFIFVGEGSQALFNTIGHRNLFCITRQSSGFAITTPAALQASVQVSSLAAASVPEVEPNNSCQAAQDIGALADSLTVNGSLDSSDEVSDIDFFRFTGTPGVNVTVDHEGQATGKGTLGDPLLGFYDSNCFLIASNDDSGSLNSHLDITIPSDGVFILAATAYPDFEFDGGGSGSYQLTVAPESHIGSISGVVVDADTGQPLSGHSEPFVFVRLLHCVGGQCIDVSDMQPGSDGRFHFETDYFGSPLRTGHYFVTVSGDQYHPGSSNFFQVGSEEDYDVGNVLLHSYPLRFGEVRACSVPSQGGNCEFSVRVTNGLSTPFNGKVWSIIHGFSLGSFTDFTTFQADTVRDLSLEPGRGTVLRFRFQVRAAVRNGAVICAAAYAGQNPNAFYNTVGERFLFCFEKGFDGFTLLSPAEIQEHLQQVSANEALTSEAPVKPGR